MSAVRIDVDEADAGMRLDALIARAAGVSRARAAELVAAGAFTVGGRTQPKSYRVAPGDLVEGEAIDAPPAPPEPLPAFGVAWEDGHVVVVDKPCGVVVHPASGIRSGTLVDALAASGRPLAPRGGVARPGIVHRLDRDVSGLLVVAKTDEAHERLVAAMQARRIRREYLAGVAGAPDVDRGKIDAPVGRHPRHRTRMAVLADGKPSVTWFRVLERLDGASLLDVRLETGRTHQIRTHLASIGLPILGDQTYGRDPGRARRVSLTRPFLHAYKLTFDHPATGERIALRSDLPADLREALEAMRG